MAEFAYVVVWSLFAAGLAVLVLTGGKLWRHETVLRYEPRRPVPWDGIDLLLIVCAFLLLQWMCIVIALQLAGISSTGNWTELSAQGKLAAIVGDLVSRLLTLAIGVAILVVRAGATATDLGLNWRPAMADIRCGILAFVASLPLVYGVQRLVTELIPYEHQLIDVVHSENGIATWFIASASAVLVAPLMEEFLFRILLQGWLEKLELSLVLRLPAATLRQSPAEEAALAQPRHGLFRLPLGTVPILVSALLFALTHFREGPESVALRLLAVTPLFVFGLFLGFVYQRTHRLLPSLTVHMSLNALTMISLLLGVK
jgi:membrane protease YdiL (CAAX protease family)